MTDQPEKLDLHSMDLTEEKRLELLALFPEARTEDGKIDFDRLKLALGEMVDVGKERYGMNWPGKADCFRAIQTPSTGTLLPCPEESVNFDSTENMIIEGDNLEVLKLLQKSYLGKIKMIYIDPPYNTGNDFVYPDDFSDSMQKYLEFTGQVDAQGRKFGTNSDTDGRYHSRWMNMMYPRLYLAKNLLSQNGVIFISIDDTEVPNLRKLCDEIFGEENFVANIVWQKKYAVSNDDPGIAPMHDHIIVYAASSDFSRNLLPRTEKQLQRYENLDNDPRGLWSSDNYISNKSRFERPTLWYPIKHPKTGEDVWPDENAVWRYSLENHLKIEKENRLYWGPNQSYKKPRIKRFLTEIQEGIVPSTWWQFTDVGHNDEGQKETAEILGKKVFDTPKPVRLLKRILTIGSNKDDLILDFFAGSGSLGQAILEQNKLDSGNRRFILVQLPEPIKKEGFNTISEITVERIRRVIAKINSTESDQLPLNELQDRGFRVFKQAPSNFKPWNSKLTKDTAALEKQLELHIDHIREGRSQSDILYEILLKSGFPLTTKIDNLNLAGKHVNSIAEGKVLICLERDLTLELIQAIAGKKPERVICLDAGFAGNDQLKANAVQLFKTHEIISFKTV